MRSDGSAAAPELPHFPYHPDPVRTGSVLAADVRCVGCDRVRPYTYAGPVYSTVELDDSLCPWCIADGTAARRFDAEFTAVLPDHRSHLPAVAIAEVVSRTPGFSGWQEERWLHHCGDVAAFLGPAGAAELARFPDALDCLREEGREFAWSPDRTARYLATLDREQSPTAYLFRCRVCGVHLAYSDSL